MKNPLVSIYIPTHNRSCLLKKAVESVLNQSYKNIEVLICDDGSTDDTEEVVQTIIRANSNKRVVYLKNDQPYGACYSRNKCIKIAKGVYITGLDDDDEFTKDRIDSFVNYVSKTRNEFLTSGLLFFNGEFYKRDNSIEEEVTLSDMGFKNVIGNQVFAPRNMFLEVGGFDESFPAWQDYDMWFRMIKKFGPCYRLENASYIMNVSSERKRITTGGNAHLGYIKFITKHKDALSKEQLKSLYLRDIINRNDSLCLRDLNKCLSSKTLIELSKYLLRKRFSSLDRVVAKIRSRRVS